MRLRPARQGFTLLELIVAATLASLAGATLLLTLRRQERFYSSAAEMLQVRGQLRDAADVMAADIRSAAVARYGVPRMADTALELFSSIGSSVACETPSGRTLFFPPTTLASGTVLTSLLATPDTGDLALIYTTLGGVPDSGRWIESRIAAFAPRSLSTSCPPATGFTTVADASSGRSGYVLTLAASPEVALRKGAPVQFIRRARYSLYRSSDGAWYLGYRRCNALGSSICGTIQPASGPYLPYQGAGTGASGLAFRYFDRNGAQLVDPSNSATIARIDVMLRGETALAASLTGDSRVRYRDSAIVRISPRNRQR